MSFLSVVLALRFRPMYLLVGGRCMGEVQCMDESDASLGQTVVK